ncbi:tripartite tricarboxylate transporter TctB family protein [Oceanispirochaeta crateris]|uniref:Tripartite tricarboxylate transporter TctB family protein n=1 Tax=Oceanispirochaeta crateris TaxID=2518645 RepID=A0A5C1QQ61_9SPIO|nr:tripartite tricarboxylate transporter TctB family protein [Oceanispirochaeta crateris]QEN08272.1 tripartite tricarboxylate transporter TctB family protein [Oceanispirochaeta crateris]
MIKVANVISLFFALLCLFVFFVSRSFPSGFNGNLGPGFFPLVLSIIGFFLSILQIVVSFKSEETSVDEVKLISRENSRVWFSLLFTALYFGFLHVVGFLIASVFYLLAMLFFLGNRNKKVLILVPILVPIFLYFVFTTLLLVQLPSGLIF